MFLRKRILSVVPRSGGRQRCTQSREACRQYKTRRWACNQQRSAPEKTQLCSQPSGHIEHAGHTKHVDRIEKWEGRLQILLCCSCQACEDLRNLLDALFSHSMWRRGRLASLIFIRSTATSSLATGRFLGRWPEMCVEPSAIEICWKGGKCLY